jgi:unsaturated rhamnogalacturonyl hydrolase
MKIRAWLVWGVVVVTALCAGADGRAQAAADHFTDWPAGAAPVEVGRRVIENFLPRAPMLTPQDGTIHYAEACTWYGALTLAELMGDRGLTGRLMARYEPLLRAENARLVPMREHVDWTVWGIVALEIHRQQANPHLRGFGLQRADRQWHRPRADGLSQQTRFWIDDMYMIAAIQTQAYRVTGEPVYLERTARAMVAYLEKLQQPNGLFFHGEKGRHFWGRGNGWMAAGMTELLRELPPAHPDHPRILAGYQQMMATLLATQGADGLWRQLTDRPEAWPETSSTGMFAFALVTGVKRGWLDAATYGPAARRAWLGLVGYVDANGQVREVCKGMGQRVTAEEYLKAARADGDYHGQAPLLWTASALLR